MGQTVSATGFPRNLGASALRVYGPSGAVPARAGKGVSVSPQAMRSGLGWRGLVLTGAVSLAAHGVVLAALVPADPPVQIAGGAAAAPAALGSAFEDFVQGATPSTAAAAPAAEVPPAPPAPVTETAPPAAAQTAAATPATQAMVSPETPAGLVATGAAPNTPLAALEAPSLMPLTPALVPPASQTPPPAAATPTAPVMPSTPPPPETAQPVTPPTLAPAPEVDVQTADAATPRPAPRPDLEARERLREQEARQQAERAEQARAAQAAGNSEQNARRGSTDGTTGAAAQSAARSAPQASAPGNAEVSNYPGEVMRRIQRVRQARVSSRGTAVVAFTVADGGGLASATLARASGSAELDNAALDHIRRAAPFPAPPPGAQRRFSFEFVGR